MVMNQSFTTASPVSAIYNYTDVANGTGVVTLYGKVSEASTGDEYSLSGNSQMSSDSGVETGTISLDLTPFNIPRTAKGTAEVFFTCRPTGTNSFSARIYHRCPSTATSTAISPLITTHVAVSEREFLLNLPLTEKLFRKGDVLRLIMTVGSPGIYMKPDKPLVLNMPFKLDL